MADIFVDNIIQVEKRKEDWFIETKGFIKHFGFKKMLDLFLKASEEVNEVFYNKNHPKFKTGLNIIKIADNFGLKPLGKKLRMCPFHTDKSPSLSLSKEKEVFNCFGCGLKGNVITFYALLKKIKKENDNPQ